VHLEGWIGAKLFRKLGAVAPDQIYGKAVVEQAAAVVPVGAPEVGWRVKAVAGET
jgi:hypothetical protein